MGGAFEQPQSALPVGLERHRVAALFLLTAFFVVVKTIAHDVWSVAFGLAMLGVILLTPEPAEHSRPWRGHALRVVSACFVVVTLASIWTSLNAR